jgi:hypothetical protein
MRLVGDGPPQRRKEVVMTTLERQHDDLYTPMTESPPRRRSVVIPTIIAVLALVIGGVAGWMLRGTDDTDIAVAGDGDLTARQEQMVDLVRDAEQAWQAGDADGVVALFAPNGTFEAEAFGRVYRAGDGSLAGYIEAGNWTSLDVLEPMLVNGNDVLTFHNYGGQTYSEKFTFTTTGDLLILSHVIHS